MKKLSTFLGVMLLMLLPVLQSCDDDGYSIGDIASDWATVRVAGGNTYYLLGDTWGSLWPAATSVYDYNPVDGERVIVTFNPLSDDFGKYDHAVKVEKISRILTKTVEELTAENEDKFGNDPITINKKYIWISGGYLNMIVLQNIPNQKPHLMSLVQNTTAEPVDDGYIHLEFRYNTYDDLSGIYLEYPVSFNLNSLDFTSETKGIKLHLNSKDEGEVEMTFDLNH